MHSCGVSTCHSGEVGVGGAIGRRPRQEAAAGRRAAAAPRTARRSSRACRRTGRAARRTVRAPSSRRGSRSKRCARRRLGTQFPRACSAARRWAARADCGSAVRSCSSHQAAREAGASAAATPPSGCHPAALRADQQLELNRCATAPGSRAAPQNWSLCHPPSVAGRCLAVRRCRSCSRGRQSDVRPARRVAPGAAAARQLPRRRPRGRRRCP